MPFTTVRLQELLHPALNAAFLAGQRIMKHYGRIQEIDSKGREQMAGDVVTVADRESQQIIIQQLAELDPNLGFCGEEEGCDASRTRFEKEAFWCVDPLDGTLPFLEKVNGFAVSIALVSREGEALLGVAHAPALEETYWAVRGGKAYRNGVEISVGKVPGVLRVSTAWPDIASQKNHAMFIHILDGLKQLERIKSVEISMHSGAVVRGCRLCEKPPSIYFCFPRPGGASIWDFAATACIVKAAGGGVSDAFGNPMDLNRPDSTYMHHRGILYASDEELAKTVLSRYAEAREQALAT